MSWKLWYVVLESRLDLDLDWGNGEVRGIVNDGRAEMQDERVVVLLNIRVVYLTKEEEEKKKKKKEPKKEDKEN